MTSGGRNLVILGVASAVIAITTTGISLMIYHNSGDIYLDRSRPGFLPDEEEISGDDTEEEYVFDKNGTVTKETLEEYLKHLNEEVDALELYANPFAEEMLSDSKLGIPEE